MQKRWTDWEGLDVVVDLVFCGDIGGQLLVGKVNGCILADDGQLWQV